MMNYTQVFPDIEPIPQNDGPHPVCAIDYPKKFVEAMNYLRAIMNIGEHSERALELTALCLRFNPANYSVWWFRRQCISTLSNKEIQGNDNEDENNTQSECSSSLTYYTFPRIKNDLELASDLGGGNPKNYQIWYHRRSLLEYTFESLKNVNREEELPNVETKFGIKTAIDELEYIASVLEEDAKNYHAWSHRQWILKTVDDISLWSEELKYVDTLIEQDVRNNSAWNQRWFAVHKGHKYPPITIEAASMEAKYVNEYAAQDPYNESPFRYLVALVKEQRKNTDEVGIDVDEKRQASKYTELLTAVEAGMEEMKVELGKGNDCPSLISAYIDVLQIKNDEDSIRKAVDMANDLSMQFDIVRKKYWSMRKTKLLNQVSTLSQDEMI